MSRTLDTLFNDWRANITAKQHNLETFFLEINTSCNLYCKHCYIPQCSRDAILPFTDIKSILKEIEGEWGKGVGIAITGGEPLLHPSFWEIAKYLCEKRFNWSLATNGILLNNENIPKLKELGCGAITISLDGDYTSHKEQRGEEGQFRRVMENIELLVQENFAELYITSTIHDANISSLDFLADLVTAYSSKVKWRINPLLYCENAVVNGLSISEETYKRIYEFRERFWSEQKIDIMVGEKSPLSFVHGEYLYSDFDKCFAGIITFGVLANGDIVNCMPCREEVLGNVHAGASLREIWENQDVTVKGLCERHIESKNPIWKK